SRRARHNPASRSAPAIPETECDRVRVAASDSASDRQETSRARDRQSFECLQRRLKVQPSETVLCLRKTADECTRERSPGSRTRLCNRHQTPACECCCRNQTQLLPSASTPASLRRVAPSTPSISPHTQPDPSHAALPLPPTSNWRVRIHSTDRARSSDL